METLADRIARDGPLTELDAVGWAIRLAKRIETMHVLGVTHGSVSPQCVLVEGKDRTARASLVDVRRTPSSAAFHSPERANGGGLSLADDTWALACTLYTTLTGSTPFHGANDAEIKQKILNSAPAPLAVFDVGDDDLQRVLDDAFHRELSHRTATVSALRRALEEWHPDPNVGGLPGLEDEDTEGGSAGDEEDEDERTIMRPAPMMMARPSGASSSGAGGIPAPRASSPGGIPAPRASSPGAFGGLSPLAAQRNGPAARAVPVPRASSPGAAPLPFASAPSRDLRVPAPRASSGDRSPASSPGGFPPPAARPPSSRELPKEHDDEDEEDEKTMMRSVPENLAAAMQARMPDASRSGAFVAAAPSSSGAFPAVPAAPPRVEEDEPEAEEEATRMIASPAFLMQRLAAAEEPEAEDDDDEQKTIMRTSLTPEEVARLEGAMPPPRGERGGLESEATAPVVPPTADGAPGDEEPALGGTMTLDQLQLAHAQGPGEPLAGGADVASGAASAGSAEASVGSGEAGAGAFAAVGAGGRASSPETAPGAFPQPTGGGGGAGAGVGTTSLATTGTAGAATASSAPRGRGALWLVIALLLVIAGAAFAYLRFLR